MSGDGRAGPHPPIGDYAMIGDRRTAALVSRSGSVDWWCVPRFDSGAVFGRLLDWERGGFCQLSPTGDGWRSTRHYLDGTLVLVTTFEGSGGEVRVFDCCTIDERRSAESHRRLLRIVEGVRGKVDMAFELAPRFDYGGLKAWIRRHGANQASAIGGDDALVVSSDAELEVIEPHDVAARFTVRAGERIHLVLTCYRPEELDSGLPPVPAPEALDGELDRTVRWWRRWSRKLRMPAEAGPSVPTSARTSAAVLQALVYAPTGAIVAAPTTSLPESVGHERNWDYRYCWIRDSQFTVRSLVELGCDAEAEALRRFLERSAAGDAASVQVLYGVGGERRLPEMDLDLDGYRSSRPVRIGNGAAAQRQLDAYGYLLELAWRWHERGRSPDDDYWRFLVGVVDRAAEEWEEPDCGIWEMRGKPQHFVHSKVMCWAALDRGIRLAEQCLRRAPLRRWRQTRDEIRRAVESRGYDRRRGVFVQAFGSRQLDAGLLLLPSFDFVDYGDERMVRTVDAIREDLDDGGLLRRYRSDDALQGTEGAFLAASFWLAECLVGQGRLREARAAFDRAAQCANDVGLFAEEFDTGRGEPVGNFPQGLAHLSHIAAAVALDRAGPAEPARPS